ncbi:MAG: N-6 DNA methylase [Verrucomicrobia bacterium]|nr:N-6 DNA methylase [Verrucomicrobiota bacterium]MBU1733995.1 N-6 DNA methylase [Verrucomicrobiota bacterium]MBU1856649.1 N-6 DNA methylase [Verrucomicrobiota bacterium]
MNIVDFIAKWKKADLKERSAAQEHFLDLCCCLGHPTPADADPTGNTFCFEKGASKQGGGEGFADVWKKDFFGWEYKGKHKDLDAAYNQLLLYRDALANPPLLVVCDLDRIIVRTNFTGTVSAKHEIALDQLGEPRSLEVLRAVFFEPEKLRPGKTSEAITQDAAQRFAGIAESMRATAKLPSEAGRKHGLDSAHVAHFLDRVVFCLFAEDIGLLPDMIFSRIVEKSAGDPVKFCRLLSQLFEAMGKGGEFGLESIRHFNGNLFDDASVPELTADEVQRIADTARMDWSAVDPSIFGTLFERGLDPSKRSQLGAHFTGKDDIETLVEAVVMQPLRREWAESKLIVESLLTTGRKSRKPEVNGQRPEKKLSPTLERKARGEAGSLIHQFLDRLQNVKVLDPACGSGNFLYVTLQKLKDLEKEAILYLMDKGLGSFLPMVGPWQLYAIEINPYAHDLAQMTVWIGWLQWIRFNGFGSPQDPILRPMEGNFRCMDAILDLTDPANPKEPDWPRVDFIVGNPPFLGDKMMRRELGDEYVDKLRSLYEGRIPGQSDLCCYWFEKARAHIEKGGCKRAGLLATQGIRGGANREVLKRIQDSGNIFWAISDKDWILDGANVHVSLIAFDGGAEERRTLDGQLVSTINPNLSAASDLATAKPLSSNRDLCFLGDIKGAAFDITDGEAQRMLSEPNAAGVFNSSVVLPWINGLDVTRRNRSMWIIDFGVYPELEGCVRYQEPFAFIDAHVRPVKSRNRREIRARYWWRHSETHPEMRCRIAPLPRFLTTVAVAKHRLFVWMSLPTLPDHAVFVFARSDDLFFGILQSRFHEVWALKLGTRLETRPRYTPSTCFETFPFPLGVLNTGDPVPSTHAVIAAAAKELNELRDNWLNPSEWTRTETLEFPGTVGGPWDRYIDPATVTDRGAFKVGTVRYPRIVARDAECAARLKERTLTKLYNARPAWLATCHEKLDAAVATAYGWPADLTEDAVLERLLALNQGRRPE